MFRFYLRLSLLPLTLFSAVLLLIHAQPYDDHDLRQLLLPEGCPAPCFMGIRPGVTTEDEALKILRSSGWVRDLTQYCMYADCGANGYKIAWSDKAPSWMNHKIPSILLNWDTNIVAEIYVMTTDEIHFFDLYDSGFGQLTMMQKVVDNQAAIEIMAPQYMLHFLSSGYMSLCRQNLSDFLAFSMSVIYLGEDIKYGADVSGKDSASLRDLIKSRLWNRYCIKN